MEAPELVRAIHEDYVSAGADIITTNTFRTNVRTFLKVGEGERYREATIQAVKIAQEVQAAASRMIYVGGVIAPLEDCYDPAAVPSEHELAYEHKLQIELVASLGVDFIFIETMNCIRESVIALQYAKRTSLPVFISFVINDEGDLLSGEFFTDLLSVIMPYAPEVILLNCRPPVLIERGLKKLRAVYKGMIGVYANGAGRPAHETGWEFTSDTAMDVEQYLTYVRGWVVYNLKIIGGCCGTTPQYIRAIAQFINA